MRLTIIALILVMTLCCNSSNENTDLKRRLSKIEEENKRLKGKVGASEKSEELNPNSIYAFILLGTEREVLKNRDEINFGDVNAKFYKTVTGVYISTVRTVNDSSDDTKYRMMDEFQSEFYRKILDGKVTDRQVFFFSTYGEASRVREKYMVSQ